MCVPLGHRPHVSSAAPPTDASKRPPTNQPHPTTNTTHTQESGWKLVHGDVFRPPQFSPLLLAVLAGTGAQLFAMALSTLTFALLGFMSPANRGGLLTSLLLLFVFMGAYVRAG